MAGNASLPRRIFVRALQIAATIALTLFVAFPAFAADAQENKQAPEAASKVDAEKLFGAIVKVSTRSVPGARRRARARRP